LHFPLLKNKKGGRDIKEENNHKLFYRSVSSAENANGVACTFVIFNISWNGSRMPSDASINDRCMRAV
jgi:hypothetical protein